MVVKQVFNFVNDVIKQTSGLTAVEVVDDVRDVVELVRKRDDEAPGPLVEPAERELAAAVVSHPFEICRARPDRRDVGIAVAVLGERDADPPSRSRNPAWNPIWASLSGILCGGRGALWHRPENGGILSPAGRGCICAGRRRDSSAPAPLRGSAPPSSAENCWRNPSSAGRIPGRSFGGIGGKPSPCG